MDKNAFRDLAVAVDSECPTIIGGAHMVFYGEGDAMRKVSMDWIRRSLDKLTAAVEAAEAALKAEQRDAA